MGALKQLLPYGQHTVIEQIVSILLQCSLDEVVVVTGHERLIIEAKLAAWSVCPVFNSNSQAGLKNPNAVLIGGGDYTILGPNVSVPTGATNGNGAGSPGGAHSTPGDSDYTAIWA